MIPPPLLPRAIAFASVLVSSVLLGTTTGQTSGSPERPPSPESLAEKAARIHAGALTIDSHADTPMRLVRSGFDIGERHERRDRGGRVDLPRMKEGGLDAIFFAVFVGQGERTPEANERARDRALGLFEAIHAAVNAHPDLAGLALTPDDALALEAEGKRAIFLGIENGYPIGRDFSLLKRYHALGARYVTLCHSGNNDICDSATDPDGPEHHGLSEFGEQVVAEMNRLGIMVDVSHASDETFYDVIRLSKTPIIASHSCARALCDSPRNLDDDMLRALAKDGGVVQLCLVGSYLKEQPSYPERDAALAALLRKYGRYLDLSEEEREKMGKAWEELNRLYPQASAAVSDAVDHIDHIVEVAGIDHVGVGTDFDGGGGIDGCTDVSEMGNLTLALVERGYSEEQIRKIWGGNLMRVLREVQKVAEERE